MLGLCVLRDAMLGVFSLQAVAGHALRSSVSPAAKVVEHGACALYEECVLCDTQFHCVTARQHMRLAALDVHV